MFAAVISIWLGSGVRAHHVRLWALHSALRAGLVKNVDRAVGQFVITQVPRRQLGRGLDAVVGITYPMMAFVAGAQALKNPHRLLDRRLVNDDLLETARERAVLLDVLELLVRRRANQAQLAGRQDWLDERRQIHRPSRRRPGADGGVDLVDEEDWHRALRECVDNGLETLFEVAAEPRAGQQGAGIEREDLGAFEQVRDVVVEEARRESFGKSRLADAGIADEHRVVLTAPAQNLHCPLELVAAADERVEFPSASACRQVRGIRRQRIASRCAAALADASLGVRRRFAGVRTA